MKHRLPHGQAKLSGYQRNIERSPFSAWVHFAFAAAERARRATGAATNGALREADRERLTVRGHLLRGNIFIQPMPTNADQCRAIVDRSEQAIVGSSGQASRDLSAGAAVRAEVFWWCDPCAPTANRTALQTPDLRERRALDAPGPKLVRPQRPHILCGSFRQHERASGAAALGSMGAPGRPHPARPGRALTVSPGLPQRACRPGLPALRRTNFVADE